MLRSGLVASILLASCGPAARPAARPAPAPIVAPSPPLTRELVEDLVKGRRHWSDVIDPAIGVTFVQYTMSESDPGIFTASSHRCGEAAVLELDGRRSRFETAIQMDEIFECSNDPGPGTCELGIAGEFGGKTRLIFARGGRGLRLDTVEDVNSSYAPKDEAAVLARLRAQQRGVGCR
jgi:hypothetical protein